MFNEIRAKLIKDPGNGYRNYEGKSFDRRKRKKAKEGERERERKREKEKVNKGLGEKKTEKIQ